jgi:hypothetical protein
VLGQALTVLLEQRHGGGRPQLGYNNDRGSRPRCPVRCPTTRKVGMNNTKTGQVSMCVGLSSADAPQCSAWSAFELEWRDGGDLTHAQQPSNRQRDPLWPPPESTGQALRDVPPDNAPRGSIPEYKPPKAALTVRAGAPLACPADCGNFIQTHQAVATPASHPLDNPTARPMPAPTQNPIMPSPPVREPGTPEVRQSGVQVGTGRCQIEVIWVMISDAGSNWFPPDAFGSQPSKHPRLLSVVRPLHGPGRPCGGRC